MKLFTLFLLMSSLNASALPVLRESAGDFSESFVTIYPDHKDTNLFYFLPNQIRFASDKTTGLPSFSLMTYGIEQPDLSKALGYFSFVFRPSLSDDVKKDLKTFQEKHAGARLAPLPVGESYLTIGKSRDGTPTSIAAKLFDTWELPPFGGLLETEVGGNGYLTGVGAKVMNNAIRTVGLASVLNSCYTVDGVTPMMDATIKIKYDKVFEHFKAQATVGWWIIGASVAVEVSKLMEEGLIDIQLHGDTKMEDTVMELARQLAKEYLAPSLANQPTEVSPDLIPFRMIRFGFGMTRVEERKLVTVNIKKQVDIKDVRCIAAPFSGLAPFADKLISNTPL